MRSWGFGCPARRDAHSSSLSTRGVLQRAPEPAEGLLPSPIAPPSLIYSWDSQPSWRSHPSPAGKPPAGRSGLCPALPAGGGSGKSALSSHRPLGQQGQAPLTQASALHRSQLQGPGHTAAPVQECGQPGQRTWLRPLCRPPPGRPCPAGPGTPGPTASVAGAVPPSRRGRPGVCSVSPAKSVVPLGLLPGRAAAPAPRPAPPPRPGRRAGLRAGGAALAPCTDAAEPQVGTLGPRPPRPSARAGSRAPGFGSGPLGRLARPTPARPPARSSRKPARPRFPRRRGGEVGEQRGRGAPPCPRPGPAQRQVGGGRARRARGGGGGRARSPPRG